MNTYLKIVLSVLLTAAIVGGGTYAILQKRANDDKATLQANIDTLNAQVTTLQKQVADAATAAKATAAADAWKNYTNTDYKFSLTFGDLWKGYEVKKVVPTDDSALAYHYFNMPTSDSSYKAATQSTSAGFASIFAISVYTPAQWTALQAMDGPITAIKITANTNTAYVFAYQHGQAYPDALATNASNISTVIGTLKNN